MAGSVEEVMIRFIGQDQLSPTLNNIQRNMNGLQQGPQGIGRSLGGMEQSYVGSLNNMSGALSDFLNANSVIAGAVGIYGVNALYEWSVGAAAFKQSTQVMFNLIPRLKGQTKDLVDHIKEYAEGTPVMFRYAAEGMRLVASSTKLSGDELKQILPAVMDIASAYELMGKRGGAMAAFRDMQMFMSSGSTRMLIDSGISMDVLQKYGAMMKVASEAGDTQKQIMIVQKMVEEANYKGIGSADTFNLKISKLKGTLRAAGTTLGSALLPPLTTLVVTITKLLRAVGPYPIIFGALALGFGVAAAAISPFLMALIQLGGTLGIVAPATAGLGAAAATAAPAEAALAASTQAAAVAMVAQSSAAGAVLGPMTLITPQMYGLAGAQTAVAASAPPAAGGLSLISGAVSGLGAALMTLLANPLTWVLAAVALLAVAFVHMVNTSKNAMQKMDSGLANAKTHLKDYQKNTVEVKANVKRRIKSLEEEKIANKKQLATLKEGSAEYNRVKQNGISIENNLKNKRQELTDVTKDLTQAEKDYKNLEEVVGKQKDENKTSIEKIKKERTDRLKNYADYLEGNKKISKEEADVMRAGGTEVYNAITEQDKNNADLEKSSYRRSQRAAELIGGKNPEAKFYKENTGAMKRYLTMLDNLDREEYWSKNASDPWKRMGATVMFVLYSIERAITDFGSGIMGFLWYLQACYDNTITTIQDWGNQVVQAFQDAYNGAVKWLQPIIDFMNMITGGAVTTTAAVGTANATLDSSNKTMSITNPQGRTVTKNQQQIGQDFQNYAKSIKVVPGSPLQIKNFSGNGPPMLRFPQLNPEFIKGVENFRKQTPGKHTSTKVVSKNQITIDARHMSARQLKGLLVDIMDGKA